MRINPNSFLRGHSNLNSVVRGPVASARAASEKFSIRHNRDRVTLSNRRGSILEQLMKQRQDVTEQKNALIHDTLERKGNLKEIQPQLDAFEEQLKMIETQMADELARQAARLTEQPKEKEKDEPKTEEELQNERMADLSNLTVSLDQIKTVYSAKTRVDQEVKTLRVEISLDKENASHTGGAHSAIDRKEEKVEELEARASDLMFGVGKMLADAAAKTGETAKQSKPELRQEETTEKVEEMNETEQTETTAGLDKAEEGKKEEDDD